jgi:hypothetical protein
LLAARFSLAPFGAARRPTKAMLQGEFCLFSRAYSTGKEGEKAGKTYFVRLLAIDRIAFFMIILRKRGFMKNETVASSAEPKLGEYVAVLVAIGIAGLEFLGAAIRVHQEGFFSTILPLAVAALLGAAVMFAVQHPRRGR